MKTPMGEFRSGGKNFQIDLSTIVLLNKIQNKATLVNYVTIKKNVIDQIN